jgi:hypothetical protein
MINVQFLMPNVQVSPKALGYWALDIDHWIFNDHPS